MSAACSPGGDPPEGPQHSGRGATAAASTAVRRVPPVSRPSTPVVPSEGQQSCTGVQGRPMGWSGTAAFEREPMQYGKRGTNEATRLGARPGRPEKQTAVRQSSRPPPCGAPRPSP